jgi:hypothetical protein
LNIVFLKIKITTNVGYDQKEIDVIGVDKPDHAETTNLDKIASEYIRSNQPTIDETIYYKCLSCNLYYDRLAELKHHLMDTHGLHPSQHNEVKICQTIKCLLCIDDHAQFVLFDSIQEAVLHRCKNHLYSIRNSPAQPVIRYIIKPDETEIPVKGKLHYYKKNCISETYQCPCHKSYRCKSLAVRCMLKHVGIKRFKCPKNHIINPGEFCIYVALKIIGWIWKNCFFIQIEGI